MSEKYYFKEEWNGDALGRSWKRVLTEYMLASGRGGSISREVSTTITWGISVDISVSYGLLTAALGFNYSESKTESTTYRFDLLPGEKARIVYIPKFHFKNGYLTITKERLKETGPSRPLAINSTEIDLEIITVLDNQWTQVRFPIVGGYFDIEVDVPTFYTDSRFGGKAIRLEKGDYDWGSFPNDEISSLRVPDDYKVVVFTDTRFQGASKTYEPGNYDYVGNDFNDKISSIKIM